jgi:uncharacterized protein YqcC (DUF446 family)
VQNQFLVSNLEIVHHSHSNQTVATMAARLARIWQSVLFQDPSSDRVLSFDPFVLDELEPNEFWTLIRMYS